MALATLSIDIEARLARLEEGLDKAARINAKAASDVERRWQAASTSIKAALAPLAAAFSVEALRQFTIGNAQAVDSLNDIADATGSTVESISALQDIARRTGTDIGTVDTALVKLNQALSAAKPDSDQAKALKAIGLSATELKKLDPAEALRQVAVALSGFADDGNKARLVQELFGKSLREVAPLLKDLAQQTQLVGSVTKEQADQAERFVHALGQYETAAARARQAFVVSILPVITDFIERINAATEAHGGFLKALAKQNPLENMPTNPVDGIIKYRAELEKLQATIDKAGSVRQGTPLADKLAIEANTAKARLVDVKEFIAYYERLLKLTGSDDNSGAAPAFTGRSVADITGAKDSKAKKGIAADLDFRRSEIAGTEKVNNDLRLAQYDEFLKDRKARIDAEILQNKQVFQSIDDKAEREDEAARIAANGVKRQIEELSEFAKQAQRNIQDALGETLRKTLKGDFDGILSLWGNMLLEMLVQAEAAKLNEALFGKPGKDGAVGTAGALTDLFKFFGGSFALGSESVPRDMLAFVHQGERIVPAHQNRGPSSGGTTIHQTIDARGNNDRAGVARLAASVKAATLAAVADARIRGNPAFS